MGYVISIIRNTLSKDDSIARKEVEDINARYPDCRSL